jgi:hypothetical protein
LLATKKTELARRRVQEFALDRDAAKKELEQEQAIDNF